jgi:hypothetical protein
LEDRNRHARQHCARLIEYLTFDGARRTLRAGRRRRAEGDKRDEAERNMTNPVNASASMASDSILRRRAPGDP